MTVLGVVRWTSLDRWSAPIARVQPLFEVVGPTWRRIVAMDEYPSQGLAFWPTAREATENGLVFFRAEPNHQLEPKTPQKDEFIVVDAQPAVEVIDLRTVGSPAEVRAALKMGLLRPGITPGRIYVWCAPSVLLGPIKLVRGVGGALIFESAHPDKIPIYSAPSSELRSVYDNKTDRFLRSPEEPLGAPIGYVDWDDDAKIVRRALTVAVARARRRGDPGLTTRLIDEAADDVTSAGTGAEAAHERYRLERAKAICAESAQVSQLASEVANALLGHPTVTASLDVLKQQVRKDTEATVRSELEVTLAKARSELADLVARQESVRRDVAVETATLAGLDEQVRKMEAGTAAKIAQMEGALNAKVQEVLERPAALLAEVGVFRAFLAPREEERAHRVRDPQPGAPAWRPAPASIADPIALKRCLASAFKARGIAPVSALRLHATLMAGLIPVVSGASAIAALAAYAQTVCGGRVCVLHVSPGFTQPTDLFGSEARGAFVPHTTGLFAATNAARELTSPALIVLEGMNRGPAESYLLPLLQLREASLPIDVAGAPAAGWVAPPALRIATTAVEAATSVPVPRDLWAFATAVEVEVLGVPSRPAVDVSEVSLSSDLFVPGDVPRDIVEEILEMCPMASDCRPALERFGGALARFETDRARIRSSLVECILLPLLATTRSDEERTEGLEALGRDAESGEDIAVRLAAVERRLRNRLG